jgi:hypothetical protein
MRERRSTPQGLKSRCGPCCKNVPEECIPNSHIDPRHNEKHETASYRY